MVRLFLAILFSLNCLLFCVFLLTQTFPWYGIILNSLSTVILIAFSIGSKDTFIAIKKYKRDILVCALLFLLAVMLYSYKIDIITPGIQGDEIAIAKMSNEIIASSGYSPFININYGHPTPLLYLTGFLMELLGKNLLSIRLPSIVFGALSVVAFYLLLKCFFNKTVSLTIATMMLFCYPLVVVSRLAYEVTPSLFFQLVTIILLYLLWKTNEIRFYIALGVCLGIGFYTYIGFKTFAIVSVGIVSFLLWEKIKRGEKVLYKCAVFLVACFIVTMPLLSYSLTHTSEISARASALSPFNKEKPLREVLKELHGNVSRLASLFVFDGSNHYPNGDPNLKQNPSQTTMFDAITFILFINGTCFMLLKNKRMLLITMLLSLSPLINDIFSLEQIPEAHYYGLGHPNTLRIAGVIPIVFFIIAYGFNQLRLYLASLGMSKSVYTTCLISVASLVIVYNYSLYYYQDISLGNYYNYIFNRTKMLNLVKKINSSSVQEIYISPSSLNDSRLVFFKHTSASLTSFAPKTAAEFFAKAKSGRLVIFDPDEDITLAQEIISHLQDHPDLLDVDIMTGPGQSVEFIIVGKKSL